MAQLAIQAQGLGKRYFVAEAQTPGRKNRWPGFRALQRCRFNEFWALRDVSFGIEHGEAVGIIGRNGAGKSTLLKMLSRVSAPTLGVARVSGRVGTLLEVGTGFHPELTGRDNIFLSGMILGMKYGEIKRKFDEIVAFSEVEKFIDTPVKRYSSGMYVRLAFAVASFLEPEILIVDEVLAVGDAAFQRKSLGRLNQASAEDGRTVLFVSHDLRAIRNFCKRVLVIEKGQLVFDGPVHKGIAHYVGTIPKTLDLRNVAIGDRLNRVSGAVRFTKFGAHDGLGNARWEFAQGEDVRFRFEYEVIERVPGLAFVFRLSNAHDGQPVWVMSREVISEAALHPGSSGAIDLVLPNIALRPNEFSIRADLYYTEKAGGGFDVIDSNADLPHLIISANSDDISERMGVVSLPYRVSHINENTSLESGNDKAIRFHRG